MPKHGFTYPLRLAVSLIFAGMLMPYAGAQSGNGTYSVFEETVSSGGGVASGSMPASADVAVGLPVTGRVTNGTYTIYSGLVPVRRSGPAILTFTPADGSILEIGASAQLQITASDPDSLPLEYRFLINGTPLANWSGNATQSWLPAAGNSGLNLLTAEVRNSQGEITGRTIEVMAVRAIVNHP